MAGGIDDVGLGVLFGLENYPYELVGLLMHAEHLEAVHGVGPHHQHSPHQKRQRTSTPTISTTASATIFRQDLCPHSHFRPPTPA